MELAQFTVVITDLATGKVVHSGAGYTCFELDFLSEYDEDQFDILVIAPDGSRI
jgi:hypothetical protein